MTTLHGCYVQPDYLQLIPRRVRELSRVAPDQRQAKKAELLRLIDEFTALIWRDLDAK